MGIGFDPVECDKTWFADMETVALDVVSMREGAYRPVEALGGVAGLVGRLAEMVEAKAWAGELLAERRRVALRATAGRSGTCPTNVIEEIRAIWPRDGGGDVRCRVA